MSLVAWYPLIDGSLENMGLDDTPLTVNGSVPFEKARVRTAPSFNGGFMRSKFTVIGNPTVTADGIASGFSASALIYAKNSYKISNSISIQLSAKLGIKEDGNNCLWCYNLHVYGYYTNDNKIVTTYPIEDGRASSLTVDLSTIGVNVGDTITYSVTITESKVTVKINDQTFEKSDTINLEYINSVLTDSGKLFIGNTNADRNIHYYSGEIDLKTIAVSVDGTRVFMGTGEKNSLVRPLFQETTNLSACAWIKVSATDSTLACFGNGRWDVGDGWGVSLRLGLFRYYFGNAGVFTKLIEANRWYHVAMTIDENKLLKCYLDGNLIKSATVTTLPDYSEASQFYLGISEANRVFFYPFNGQLQDFRYYDHCLSTKEVKELSQGLCLHLKCDGIGAGENMLKNSAVMFNSVGINPDKLQTGVTVTKTLETDETAPCGADGKVLHVQVRKKNGADFNVFKSGSYWDSTYDRYQTPLTVGDVYCVTTYMKGTGAYVILVPQAEFQKTISSKNIKTFTDEWQRTYYIFRAVAPTSDPSATTVQPVLICYFRVPASTECDVYYCCPKIEKLTSSPYIPNPNDTQYSAYLPLQEDDCSGFGFNANYVNMTASDVEINNGNARYNTSLDFTKADSQYLLGEKSPFTTETKNFTISAWVKFKSLEQQAIFSSRHYAGVGIALFFLGGNTFRLDDGAASTAFPSVSIATDTWYHVVATRTETEKKLYINGELKATNTDMHDMSGISDRYSVGASENSLTEFGNLANANISDLRVYATALSATDIKALYETSASIDNEGNLHTYELDEGLTITSIQKTGIFHAPSIQETDGSAKIKQDEVDVNGLVEI